MSLAGALRLAVAHAAAERAGGLDADQHRELAALDDPPRLARVVDKPQPAAAAPTGLGVDVVLQRAQLGDLELDRSRSRRRMRLGRLDLAQWLVLDRLGDDEPPARRRRPAGATVIDLLVGDRVVGRPTLEGRPAVGVVRAGRAARAQQVAGDVQAAVRPMHLGVLPERLGDPEAVEALARDHAAAAAQVGRHVQVRVGEPEDAAVALAAKRLADRVERGLWEALAARGAASEGEALARADVVAGGPSAARRPARA